MDMVRLGSLEGHADKHDGPTVGVSGAVRHGNSSSSSLEAADSGARNPSDPASAAPLRHGCGAMVRGLAPALLGRAAAAARWCTCRRVAVAVCLGNLAAALLVARALYAPGTFASAPKRTPRLLSSLLPPLAVSIKLIRRLGSCLWFQAGRRSIPRSR